MTVYNSPNHFLASILSSFFVSFVPLWFYAFMALLAVRSIVRRHPYRAQTGAVAKRSAGAETIAS